MNYPSRKLRFQSSWTSAEWQLITVEQHLKASESLKDRPRSGRPQVISQEAINKMFENDPCQTRLAQKKTISFFTASRMVKKDERRKSETFQETPVECRNGSETAREEHPFVEWSEELRASNNNFFPWENFHR